MFAAALKFGAISALNETTPASAPRDFFAGRAQGQLDADIKSDLTTCWLDDQQFADSLANWFQAVKAHDYAKSAHILNNELKPARTEHIKACADAGYKSVSKANDDENAMRAKFFTRPQDSRKPPGKD